MPKDIIFKDEVRAKLREGVKTLADAVRVTLGPKGRNVIIGRGVLYTPVVTKDGVSVAREVELKDMLANIGAQVVKYVASRAADKVGDGTTTSTVLTQAIYEAGLQLVEKSVNPVDIKKGIDKACVDIKDFLKKKAIPISIESTKDDNCDAKRVATISANNDEKLGELVYDAFKIVGPTGAVIIENGASIETELKIIEGYQYDRGYINSAFCTDRSALTCNLVDAVVMIVDGKIGSIRDLQKIFDICVLKKITNLLIICEDIADESLHLLISNVQNQALKVCITKPAWLGEKRTQFLQDIAVFTGATILQEYTDGQTDKLSPRNFTEIHLGHCQKVLSTKDETTIVGGAGDKEIINLRIQQITNQMECEEDSFDKVKLQERISKLNGKIVSIQVGGATEFEQKQTSDRIDDAVKATRSALNHGIYVGGGIALINARIALKTILDSLDNDLKIGYQVVYDACVSPFNTILENAGVDYTKILAEIEDKKAISEGGEYLGYNALTGKIEDLMKAGVIDPIRVTLTAIETACSAATMLLTSECMINETAKVNPFKLSKGTLDL